MATKSAPKKTAKSARKAPVRKAAVKKSAPRNAAGNKVDYYPNRMTIAVSALAGTMIVLLALILVLG